MEKEDKKGDKVLRSERYCGKVARSFTLVHDVDEAVPRPNTEMAYWN